MNGGPGYVGDVRRNACVCGSSHKASFVFVRSQDVCFCLFVCLFVCVKLRSIKFHEKSYRYSRDQQRIITNLIGATHGSERI